MAAFDYRKTKLKQSTIFMQAAADTLYQTRGNIFIEVLLSSQIANLILILTTENNIFSLFK